MIIMMIFEMSTSYLHKNLFHYLDHNKFELKANWNLGGFMFIMVHQAHIEQDFMLVFVRISSF
jgi:hypothetical protein